MKTAKSDRAAMNLRMASRSVETYGEADTLGVLLGEMCGAVLYDEGQVDEVVTRLNAEIEKQRKDG